MLLLSSGLKKLFAWMVSDMEPGIYYDLSFKDYAALPGDNASKLKVIYKDSHARLDCPPTDQTIKGQSALRIGTISHIALLEPEKMLTDDRILPDMKFLTNEAKALKKAHIEKYGTYDFLYYDEAQKIKEMGEALRSKPGSDVQAIIDAMDSGALRTEVSVIVPGKKCRFDLIGSGMGLDYKSTKSAHPREFVKNAINLGYDLGAAWYMDVYEELTGVSLDSFAFIAQEKTSPYLFNLFEFSAGSRFIGKGRDKYKVAQKKNEWYKETGDKGYDGMVIDAESLLPDWYQ